MPPPVGTLANPATGGLGPYAQAFRSLVAYLKAHPNLATYVRTWRAWEGRNDDETVPTADQCPWVRLTPSIMPASYLGISPPTLATTASGLRRVVSPFKIGIETAVKDTNFDASAALWFNLDAALFPVDDAGRTKLVTLLNGASVSDMTLLQPALPAGLSSYGDGLIVGDGAIQLDVELIL